jgi:hypothetical protein
VKCIPAHRSHAVGIQGNVTTIRFLSMRWPPERKPTEHERSRVEAEILATFVSPAPHHFNTRARIVTAHPACVPPTTPIRVQAAKLALYYICMRLRFPASILLPFFALLSLPGQQNSRPAAFGIVAKMTGTWLIEDANGSRRLTEFAVIRSGSKVRIAPSPTKAMPRPQIGYLRILEESSNEARIICCDASKSCNPRGDCGEPILLEARKTGKTGYLELIADLLFDHPSKYHRPAIGGDKSPESKEILFRDGIAPSGTSFVLARAPKGIGAEAPAGLSSRLRRIGATGLPTAPSVDVKAGASRRRNCAGGRRHASRPLRNYDHEPRRNQTQGKFLGLIFSGRLSHKTLPRLRDGHRGSSGSG